MVYDDKKFLAGAIELSKKCPISEKAFSVGAIIVNKIGEVVASGFSRENDLSVHAEEAAIKKCQASEIYLSGATIYSSMEPCGERLSGKKSCADRIIEAKIKRVVYSLSEPNTFVNPMGAKRLKESGVEVIQYPN